MHSNFFISRQSLRSMYPLVISVINGSKILYIIIWKLKNSWTNMEFARWIFLRWTFFLIKLKKKKHCKNINKCHFYTEDSKIQITYRVYVKEICVQYDFPILGVTHFKLLTTSQLLSSACLNESMLSHVITPSFNWAGVAGWVQYSQDPSPPTTRHNWRGH